MGQIGVKTNILRLKQIQWQFCKYGKRILKYSESVYVFITTKHILERCQGTADSNSEEGRGSLTKCPTERGILQPRSLDAG